jgi:trimeric autotransporter adhesin
MDDCTGSLESHIVALLQREAPPSAAADTQLPGGSAAATAVQQQQQPQQLHGAQDALQQLPAPPQEPAESMDAATAVAALGVPAAPGPAPHTDVPIATTRHAAPAADIGETSSLGVAAMAVTDVSTEAAAGTASMQAAAAQGTDSVNLPTLSTSLSPTAVSMVQQELDAQPQAGSALHPVQAVQAMMAHDAAEGTQAAAAAPMDSDTAVASSLDEHVNAAALATVPAAMDADASGAEGAAAAPSPGEDSGLAAALAEAAAAAEIDLAFLEALPEELRVEVLAARGVTLRAAGAEVVQRDAGDTATPASTAAAHDSTMSGGLPTTGAAGADTGAAAATTPVASASEAEAIDPEFLAALPEDIRQELLAQQRASARAAAARAAAAARGQQPEMGLADLLAAMPDDARADALTQLSDDDLLQLPTQVGHTVSLAGRDGLACALG